MEAARLSVTGSIPVRRSIRPSIAPSIRSRKKSFAVDTISILSREIGIVDGQIEETHKLKDQEMRDLERIKSKLKQSVGSEIPASVLQQSMQNLLANRLDLLEEITKLTHEAEIENKNIDVINEALTAMDREIARTQNDHNKSMIALREKNDSLRNKLYSVLEVDEMIANLEDEIRKNTEQADMEMEEHEAAKRELLLRQDMPNEDMDAEIRRMNFRMQEIMNKHNQEIEFMKKQKMDIEIESVAILGNLDQEIKDLFVAGVSDYIDEIKRLEGFKLKASLSKQSAIDRAIEFYRQKVEEYNLRQKMSPMERTIDFLQFRNLAITDCGNVIDADGKVITLAMAREIGLIELLRKLLVESYGLEYIDANTVLTQQNRMVSKSRAVELGFMQDYDIEKLFGAGSTRSDMSSRDSDFLSEDAFYLKKYLGVPLTLALAEVTAKKPTDPIHYLGHWLFKYAYNREIEATKELAALQLADKRNKIAQDKWHDFLEDEARKTVLAVVKCAEIQAEKNEYDREVQRIADETAAMEMQYDEE